MSYVVSREGAKFQCIDFKGEASFQRADAEGGGQVFSAPESQNSSAPPRVPINNDRARRCFLYVSHLN